MFKLVLFLIGIVLVILGAMAQVTWLGLCFGTVIIGIAMLIFSPRLLFLPFNFIITPGFLMVFGGYLEWKNNAQTVRKESSTEQDYLEELAAQKADEARIERQKKLSILKSDLKAVEESNKGKIDL